MNLKYKLTLVITNILKKSLKSELGKLKYQKYFESLNLFSLQGMNIGISGNIQNSGEKIALNYIKKKLNSTPKITIFDVGANVGNYSKILLKIFNKNTQIFCFEPSQKNFSVLKKNLKNYKNTKFFNFGLGNKNSFEIVFSNPDKPGLTSLYQRNLNHFNTRLNQKNKVKIKTLDSFCQKNKIKHIHLLKLDVEGHEFKILKGSSKMFQKKSIDFIQFEFGGCNIDSKIYFQNFYYFLRNNYNIYRIVKNGLYPISQYKELYEKFITTNYLAQKK